jgi:hypothetical protein
MKKLFAFASGLLALSALVVLGADIDGKWTRETQGKNGPQTQILTLKSDGGKLTGTMEGGGGGGGKGGAPMPVAISEGTVSGANVSFKIVRDFGGNSVTQTYKGTVSATELKLTQDTEGGGGGKGGGKGPQELVFKK